MFSDELRSRLSPLVDANWYHAHYGDDIEDAYEHYWINGVALGAEPNPYFDTSWYLKSYPDVRDSGANPLEHYARVGWKEGRNPSAAFDGDRYLDDNPDVRASRMSPLAHYLIDGRREGRRIYAAADRASRTAAPQPAPKKWRLPVAVTGNDEGDRLDRAMATLLRKLATGCIEQGPIAIVAVAARFDPAAVAGSYVGAFLQRNRGKSALLLATEQEGISTTAAPPGFHLVSLADFAGDIERSARAELLLRVLRALKPEVFHISYSELGLALLAQNGERVKALTRIVGCVGDAQAVMSTAARYYCDEIRTGDGRAAHGAESDRSRTDAMTSNRPLVSVVISCRGHSRYAHEAVASAKSAYSGPLEVIVVDHSDPDPRTRRQFEGVVEAMRDERCRIETVAVGNLGTAAAYDEGVRRASGEFIQLLDCRDLLLAEKLDVQIRHFQIADALDVSVTDFLFANERLDVFRRDRHLLANFNYDLPDFAAKWARGARFPLHCALFRRTILAGRPFDGKVEYDETWLLWVRLAAANARIAFLGGAGGVWREGDYRNAPEFEERWLTSAREIDGLVRHVLPNFLDDALEWRRSRDAAASASGAVKAELPPTPKARSSQNAKGAPRFRAGSTPPRISVVVPVYEHYAYLERCLASVGAQDDAKFEVVIVDDGSRDPRIKPLLEGLARDFGAKVVVRSDNRGVAATLNEAIARAAGEYVAFLDCDDTLPPDALAKAQTYIDDHPDCDYLFTDRYDISEVDEILRLARYGGYRDDRFSGDFRRDLLNGMVASHLKVIRRSSIVRAGGFEAATSGVQDWVMALKIAEFGRFGYLPEPLYNYRVHSDTVTLSDLRGQTVRTNRVRRRFAERYFKERDSRNRLDGSGSRAAPIVLSPREISLRNLPEVWGAQPLIADASGEASAAEIRKLREFNGYFDKILWSAPEIHAALLGYVWSLDILQRV